MKDANYAINRIYEQLPKISIEEEELYKSIKDIKLEYVFAYLQSRINPLLKDLMQRKGGHYKSADSKELLKIIDIEKQLEACLSDTDLSFNINPNYQKLMEACRNFLQTSYGSEVPHDIPLLEILWNQPIFELQQTTEIKVVDHTLATLTMLGEGSYAHVYKYLDKNYDTTIVLKRAKKDLTAEELERFRTEFNTMKTLNSPFVVKVFKYNDIKNEYSMEYAETTLAGFLCKNPNLDRISRKNLITQVLKAFKYIHSKHIFHRDISPNNILIFTYDDVKFVAKISDFGLVKLPNSNITSLYTEIKGVFNDFSDLDRIGFNNYGMCHEIYALTKIIYFVMTGRKQYKNDLGSDIDKFYRTGTNADTDKRYKNVDELKIAFLNTWKE